MAIITLKTKGYDNFKLKATRCKCIGCRSLPPNERGYKVSAAQMQTFLGDKKATACTFCPDWVKVH